MPERHPKAPGSREAFSAWRRVRRRVFKMLIGQVGENREINAVFSKTIRVLGHAELFEPVRNLLHRDPSLGRTCSVHRKDITTCLLA